MSWSTWWPTSRCWPPSSACRCPASPRPPPTTRAAPPQARARHAGRPPRPAVAELEAAAEAADTEVAARGEARLDEPIDWWGGRAADRVAVLVRAFETWTHADDIRRAIGAGDGGPAAVVAAHDGPHGVRLRAEHARGAGRVPPRPARPLPVRRPRRRRLGRRPGRGRRGRPAGDDAVDAEIATEAVAVCRAVSARLDPRELTYVVVGDERLARDVVDALPALAVL